MKTAAIVLFVLAGLATLVAINNVFFSSGANRPEEPVRVLSYGVGAFVLPMVFLMAGLVLLNKTKRSGGDKDA